MTLPAAREQETTQQPGDIIVGAPAASKVSMPPSDPTQMANHQLVPAAGTYQIDPAHTSSQMLLVLPKETSVTNDVRR